MDSWQQQQWLQWQQQMAMMQQQAPPMQPPPGMGQQLPLGGGRGKGMANMAAAAKAAAAAAAAAMRLRLKPDLRFVLNDRVVCNLGIRWIGGHVVGTDKEEKDDWCYLVKTDPHGADMESRTITVPSDTETVCFQEVCFSPDYMEQMKGAAPELPKSASTRRFKVGDRVTCRVRPDADLLEKWCSGTIDVVDAPLPPPLQWGDEDMSGDYPPSVAYKVKLDNGSFVFCHADNYTLIRKEGLESQTRVKGVSKRLEDRRKPDGSLVRYDHLTGRERRIENEEGDSDNEPPSKVRKVESANELTEEQRKALCLD
eukprot:gnl/MRDRNA2_/MRDRNA2_71876_c0_seq1.p1 gnl/MRDRNA2_/MRDRNA2_71876_c0~~gnl/MRDRNA2_/MRDRNA2_71876_c0_seq1.p1  ORF type:complete len:312 (-),score=74.31 gnl/MRDRNA2_/MRDRNA2_71876_c0_seq1:52-987(-)